MKAKLPTNTGKQRLSDQDTILKLLVEFQRMARGIPLQDLLAAAKQKGIDKPKTSTILKKLETQKRIKIEKISAIYPAENYYFWHEELD